MNKHIRFDWAIKRLLRQKANFVVLEGFLTELLKFKVSIQEIIESEGNKAYETDKYNRVDLLAKDQNDDLILIEVQNEKEHDYFHRMNYGQAKLITDHINAGDAYEAVKKVFSINIVYFELGQGEDYIYVGNTSFFGMHKKDTLQLSNKQKELYRAKTVSELFATYYILKVNNFDDKAKDNLDQWIYFLKNSEIKDSFHALGLPEAKEKLRVDNLQGSEKEAYDNFIKEQRIRNGEMKTAIYDSISKVKEELLPQIEKAKVREAEAKVREAEAKARAEEKTIKLAKKMLKYNEPIEEIIKETGLTKEKIEMMNGE